MRHWCSGVKGNLQVASAAFICMQGVSGRDSTIGDGRRKLDGGWKERSKYDIVDSFCYLGYMLISTKGGADAAVTTRGRCAWKKSGEPDLMPHHVLNVQREIDYDSHEGQVCMVWKS